MTSPKDPNCNVCMGTGKIRGVGGPCCCNYLSGDEAVNALDAWLASVASPQAGQGDEQP